MVMQVKTNWIDRAIMAVNPNRGMDRLRSRAQYQAATASGYVVPGSAKKSMKGLLARANSPDDDIVPKLSGMRAISRDLAMNSGLATSILRRHKILNIGSGLQVQSAIDRETLGISQEEAEKKGGQFEREFDLWAESLNSDFEGLCTFGELQALGYLNMLQSGDFFWMPVWSPTLDKGFPYELSIKLIDADLVRDPDRVGDKDIKGGVEKNDSGQVVAYHVWNTYPYEWSLHKRRGESKRVPVFDANGRRQIYHVFDPERISQRRGVPLLAPVAEELVQLTRLSRSQVDAALLATFFTVFLRDSSGLGIPQGPDLTPNETATGGGRWAPDEPEVSARNQEDGNDLEMAPGGICQLDDQTDISIADPGKSDKDYDKFWMALATTTCGAANMPIETAQMKYTTSYVAAKAAGNDLWNYRTMVRVLMGRRMNGPVFTELLTEATLRGRVDAPGFFDDYANKIAWSRSYWVGSGKGTLDALREAKGAALELNAYTATREQQYAEKYGGRWDAAMDRRKREDAKLESLGLNQIDQESATTSEQANDEDVTDGDGDGEE